MESLRKVTLPSKGVFNNGVKEVTLDMIGFEQEKKLFSSTSDDTTDEVLQDCIVNPKDLKVEDLTLEDQKFLLYQLRIHSYGDQYHVSVLENGEVVEKEISLEDMVVVELSDDYEPPKGKLPMTGDEITIHYSTVGQLKKMKKYALDKSEKTGIPYKDIIYELIQADRIGTVNGERVEPTAKINWLKSLKGRDLAYIEHLYNKTVFGYKGTVTIYNDDGTEKEVRVPMTGEFFRPRFDD